MVKQNFCPTRLGIFFRGEDIHKYVEILKKYHNAVGQKLCNAIKKSHGLFIVHGFRLVKLYSCAAHPLGCWTIIRLMFAA